MKKQNFLSKKTISRLWLFSLSLLIVGCALPLQRGPDPEQSQTDSAEARNRNLAVESTNTDAASADAAGADAANEDAVNEDEATSEGEELAQLQSAAPTIVPEPASQAAASESGESPVAAAAADTGESAGPLIELLDLAALDQTFLETIDAARSELSKVNEHHFVEVTDARSITWQGEALIGDGQTILLMQPIQAGGQIAVRLPLEAAVEIATPEFEAALAQVLATVEIDLPAPDSYGPPDAEIQFVQARETTPGVWNFNVRLNHPDTGWEDYTDGWHVETLDGQILGVRILLHPHVNEMPFSRSQGGITIPEGVTEVQVRSHDLASGYGQETVVVPISESGSGERYEVSR